MHPASMIALHTGTTYVTASAYTTITRHLTESKLIAYIHHKHDMTSEMVAMIDCWDAFERYHTSMPSSKRVKISKYVHDWQNVGAQKQKIDNAAKATPDTRQQYKCPYGCGPVEQPQHYLRCDKSPRNKHRDQTSATIRDWMIQAKNHMLLQITIYAKMREWISGDTQLWDISDEHDSEDIQTAIYEQQIIGWDHFFRGRLSKQWGRIQDRHYEQLRASDCTLAKHFTGGTWWTSRLIQLVTYFSLNEWQTRNDTLHNYRIQSEREKRRKELKAKIGIMYRVHREAKCEALRRYYNRPYLEMITKETDHMEYWMIRTVMALYEEEANTDGSIRSILDKAVVADIEDINLPHTEA